jgi:hypothetical protein
VRAISKVADAYKLDQDKERTFSIQRSFPYDSRLLTYYIDGQEVSIWTLEGRIRVPYATGERQRRLLVNQQGQSDLVYHDGAFYLLARSTDYQGRPEGR